MTNVRDKLKKIINDSGITIEDFDVPLDMDSIIFITLIVNIEKVFNIEYPDDNLLFNASTTAVDIEKVILTCLMDNND